MDKEDARKQTREVLHERRKQVIRLHRHGHRKVAIMEQTGLSRDAVDAAIDLFESGSWAALKPARQGKPLGSGRSLSVEQEATIQRLICEKRPEQLEMDFALWSRPAVMQLIERECGINLSVRAVGNYLKRWGFTPQKPLRRAYEQKPEAVQA